MSAIRTGASGRSASAGRTAAAARHRLKEAPRGSSRAERRKVAARIELVCRPGADAAGRPRTARPRGGHQADYRDSLRLHVGPAFEHYTLAEVSTGRVEWFLKREGQTSLSRAKQSRTLLNLRFSFAMRHDAITRNPVQGTSPLPRPRRTPQALTLEQVAAIRTSAADWRTDPKLPGPRSDGQVRDIIEVLLCTAMRTGAVLALRPRGHLGVCDRGGTTDGWSFVSRRRKRDGKNSSHSG